MAADTPLPHHHSRHPRIHSLHVGYRHTAARPATHQPAVRPCPLPYSRPHAGAPPLAYLLFVYPTSMASGWLLILHCHAVSIAVSALTGGDNGADDRPATIVGCIVLSLATAVAVAVLLRYRDVVFGLSYTWGMVGVWVAGFGTFEGYLPHQVRRLTYSLHLHYV